MSSDDESSLSSSISMPSDDESSSTTSSSRSLSSSSSSSSISSSSSSCFSLNTSSSSSTTTTTTSHNIVSEQHEGGNANLFDAGEGRRAEVWRKLMRELVDFHRTSKRKRAMFRALCESLNHNDEFMTSVVDLPMYGKEWYGKGIYLGSALRDNTRVESLEIPLSIICNSQGDIDRHEIDLLLAFVRKSASLKSVRLRCTDRYVNGERLSHTSTLWLTAAAQNSHIQEFELHTRHQLPAQTLRCISQMSLKRLRIPLCRYDDRELFFTALRTNSTLESLQVIGNSDCSRQETSNLIRNLPCPPQLVAMTFIIKHHTRVIEAVVSFISKAPSSLTDFSLSHKLRKDDMECLVEGLRNNHSISKLTIERLSAPREEALSPFVAYMTQENGVHDNGIKTLELMGRFPDSMVLPLISGPRGSGLESLYVERDTADPFQQNFESYLANESKQLKFLKLRILNQRDRDHFLVHLPNMVYLCGIELCFRADLWQRNRTGVLNAIRENGRLCSVQVTRDRKRLHDPDIVSLWSHAEARLVEAFGQQNRHMPQLFQHLANNGKSDGSSSCGDGQELTNETVLPPTATLVALVPPLCLTAQRSPRMALHHVFCGMLALKDTCDPGGGTRSSATRRRRSTIAPVPDREPKRRRCN